jgi:HD-GYP domain-containing protein (c-di-GMP phosphodiesterase class II)
MVEIVKIRVDVTDLKPGMYVCELDRPWLGTPFLLQGFTIDSKQDIETLAQFCSFVYVEERRGLTSAQTQHSAPLSWSQSNDPAKAGRNRFYQDAHSWQQELQQARPIIEKLNDTIESTLHAIVNNSPYDLSKLRYIVGPMVDSVIRNPDASIWLVRLRDQDDYQYKHALGVAVWVTALGRQLGLPREELAHLAFGGILLDIGKLKISIEILQKTGTLNRQEYELIKQHVQFSVDLMKAHGGISEDVYNMVAHHHERIDGSGYPHGLSGAKIPLFARIAAIADSYDAMTSRRHYANAVSPSAAVSKLYEARNSLYQTELIEEFIQAIGIYPAGTLVELSDGRVGVVVAEYRTRRLRPRVLILLDEEKHALSQPKTLNLMETKHDGRGRPLHISRSLEPGSYDLRPEQLFRYDGF